MMEWGEGARVEEVRGVTHSVQAWIQGTLLHGTKKIALRDMRIPSAVGLSLWCVLGVRIFASS